MQPNTVTYEIERIGLPQSKVVKAHYQQIKPWTDLPDYLRNLVSFEPIKIKYSKRDLQEESSSDDLPCFGGSNLTSSASDSSESDDSGSIVSKINKKENFSSEEQKEESVPLSKKRRSSASDEEKEDNKEEEYILEKQHQSDVQEEDIQKKEDFTVANNSEMESDGTELSNLVNSIQGSSEELQPTVDKILTSTPIENLEGNLKLPSTVEGISEIVENEEHESPASKTSFEGILKISESKVIISEESAELTEPSPSPKCPVVWEAQGPNSLEHNTAYIKIKSLGRGSP